MTLTNFYATYLDLQSELDEGEASGTLSEARENDIVDRLERLWWKLTPDEQRSIDEASEQPAPVVAPSRFEFFDVIVREGQTDVAPRQMAQAPAA